MQSGGGSKGACCQGAVLEPYYSRALLLWNSGAPPASCAGPTAASLCLRQRGMRVVQSGSAEKRDSPAEPARCSRWRTRPEGSFLRLHSSAGRRDPSSSRLQSAPCSSSTRTTSACARAAAKCSALLLMISGPSVCTSRPEWCLRSASAPPWHSSRTTCGHPWQAATCSGVMPG